MGTPAQQPDAFARQIDTDLRIRLPLSRCDAPGLAIHVARTVGIPAGVEYVAVPCDWRIREAKQEISIRGWTVARILDQLVELDGTYRWRDMDGVLVMRPVSAWSSRSHFLERRIEQFQLTDKNMAETLGALGIVLGEAPILGSAALGLSSPERARQISVALSGATGLDVLNTVVRTHGAMQRELEYCGVGVSTLHARLFLSTSDAPPIGIDPKVCR